MLNNTTDNNSYIIKSTPYVCISPDYQKLTKPQNRFRFINAIIVTIIGLSLIFGQFNWVYAQSNTITLNIPLTSPITLPIPPITSPIEPPITSPQITVTPTPTPAPVDSNNSNSENNGNNGQTNTPQACSDSMPGSSPRLISVVPVGLNKVQLNWEKAQDPVTNYIVVYGLKSGQPIYGDQHAGDKNTTTLLVDHLSGGETYYFKVMAENNCMPGNYSNEVSVHVSGGKFSKPATNFTKSVLGTSSQNKSQTQFEQPSFVDQSTSAPSNAGSTSGSGIIDTILNFLANLSLPKLF